MTIIRSVNKIRILINNLKFAITPFLLTQFVAKKNKLQFISSYYIATFAIGFVVHIINMLNLQVIDFIK